jgi:RNA polymerase sigma-70 factor (ECF subfamily)
MSAQSSTVKLPYRTETEEALVLRLRQGDEEAFYELVNQHHGALIRIAITYVADREVAKDVVQDTWMAVTEGLDSFEGRSSLRTWICGILAHKAQDRGALERRHKNLSWAGHWAFPSRPWDDRTPENLLAGRQAVDAMQRAIDRLPANLKSVLILRDRDGVDASHVCAMLNINRTNLYVRLHRARERVKVAVETALG